ncbi:MAG: PilW family protein [Methanosarcinaceae archaeon]
MERSKDYYKTRTIINSSKGFTLIELMVAMVVSSILIAGIYTTYITQLKSHLTQQLIVEMQQNLRGAMLIIKKDIRMAGYDPNTTAGAGVSAMLENSFEFTMDVTGGEADGIDNDNDDSVDETDEDGFSDGDINDSNEQIKYGLDTDADGFQFLGRELNGSGGLQPVAEFIDALNFVYLDSAGGVTNDPLLVKSVQVTIVGRSSKIVPVMFLKQTDNKTYMNQQGKIVLLPQNDQFRRIIVTSNIKCRNL